MLGIIRKKFCDQYRIMLLAPKSQWSHFEFVFEMDIGQQVDCHVIHHHLLATLILKLDGTELTSVHTQEQDVFKIQPPNIIREKGFGRELVGD
jgi:hypothetical protein